MDAYNYYAIASTMSLVVWIITLVILLAVASLCAYIVYKDARKTKRMPALEWAIIAFLLPVIGLLIYFLMKNAK